MSIPDFNKYLRYDPETGNLIRTCTTGSKSCIGSVAGFVCSDGYMRTSIEGRKWKNHQIVFWMFHRRIPEKIDHENGDVLCNFHWNLREATAGQNQHNSISRVGSSKYKGVCLSKGKWKARIMVNNKRKSLGTFLSEIDAAKAYNKAAIELHGAFANLNIC